MILVAEDTAPLREAIVAHLESRGLPVIGAADGRDALARVEALGDGLRVLVTDLEMPFHSGFEVVERAVRSSPGVRTVLITSRLPATLPDLPPGLEILQKPFELRQLSALLDEPPPKNTAEPRIVPRPEPRNRSRLRPVLSLAAVLVAAMALVTLWATARAPEGRLPAPPIEDVYRSATISGLAPTGIMATVPEVFTWQPVPGAVHYRLELTDITGRSLWKHEVEEPELVLSADRRSAWPSQVARFLTAEALGPDGELLASVREQRIRVVPPEPSPVLEAQP